ncbi:MAG: hypothetical protein ACJ72M_06755, partial [Propionibacteriaceae bacterium]
MPSAPRQDGDRSLSSASRGIGRRTLLAGAAATVLGAAACRPVHQPPSAGPTVGSGTTATPPTPSAVTPVPSTGAGVRRRDWSALDRKLSGRLLRPDDSGYRAAVR